MTTFGVHVGLQHTTADELRSVWRRIEDLGFGWISVWDHFYGATGKPDDAACRSPTVVCCRPVWTPNTVPDVSTIACGASA